MNILNNKQLLPIISQLAYKFWNGYKLQAFDYKHSNFAFFYTFLFTFARFCNFPKWQKFTIDQVIYAINGLRNSEKFTIARFFTIDGVTIARFDCTSLRNLSCNLANTINFHKTLFCKPKSDLFFSLLAINSCTISH